MFIQPGMRTYTKTNLAHNEFSPGCPDQDKAQEKPNNQQVNNTSLHIYSKYANTQVNGFKMKNFH